MKLSSSIAAGLLALATASTFAADHSFGDVTADGGFGASAGALSGSFSDTYDFTLSGVNEASQSWANSWTSKSGRIDGFTVTLAGPDGFNSTLTSTVAGNSQFIAGAHPTLSAGDYVLTVSGIAQKGSSYGGSFSVSAVPEPGELGLLLGGLGALGLVAHRRRKG